MHYGQKEVLYRLSKIPKLGAAAWSHPCPPGMRTVAGSILMSDIFSWRFSHEIPDEIISTVILPLQLSQAGQLSVTGERMCTKYLLVNRLGSLPRNSGLTNHTNQYYYCFVHDDYMLACGCHDWLNKILFCSG